MVKRAWGALLGAWWLLGCGSESNAGMTHPQGGAAGTSSSAGTATAGGGGNTAAGTAASSGGTAGNGGGGGGGGGASLPPPMAQPTCDYPQAACEGKCLAAGATEGKCTYVAQMTGVQSLSVHANDIFVAGLFGGAPLGQKDDIGLYKLAGDTFARTPLDTNEGHHTIGMAIDDAKLFYQVGSTILGHNVLRAVPIDGSSMPIELVNGLTNGGAVLERGDRVYFSAALDGDANQIESLRYVAKTGGDATAAALGAASRLRANATQIAVSWNGDAQLGSLPDAGPDTELFKPGSIDRDNWWLDGDSIYWFEEKDGTYRKLPLGSAAPATPDQGQLVQTLPANVGVLADSDKDLLLTFDSDTATALYTMPIAGGPLTYVGVTEKAGAATLGALDDAHAYIHVSGAVLRFDR